MAQILTRHGSSVSELVTFASWGGLLLSHCHGLDPWWGEGSSPSQEAGLRGLLTPVIRENTSRSGLSFHTLPQGQTWWSEDLS